MKARTTPRAGNCRRRVPPGAAHYEAVCFLLPLPIIAPDGPATNAVIMAGGQGAFLASRPAGPAGEPLDSRKRICCRRPRLAASLCSKERTIIVVGAEHAALARRQVPKIPAANIVAEPVGRSTAPCIALAAELILAREKDAVMVVLPADHAIADARAFAQTMQRARELAAQDDGW
jgi:mannose-1-phosphate guanylyltransferase